MPTAMQSWRARMGFTQRQAASQLGVTLPTYQTWEREHRFTDGKAISVPHSALLAAAAVEAGLEPIRV